MNQTKLPKLPRGWVYDNHECCSDGSGGPWIEAVSPEGDAVTLDRKDVGVLKWGRIWMNVEGSDDSYTPQGLQRLINRVKTVRLVGAKLRAWAKSENRRPHDPVYAGAKEPK